MVLFFFLIVFFMYFGVLTTSIFNDRGLWCSLLSWFTLETDEVQIFSGEALTFCCMVVFLLSGKKSSSPEAKQNCCLSSGLSVHARAVVVSTAPAFWFGLLVLIAPSLAKAKPGQLVPVTLSPATSPGLPKSLWKLLLFTSQG